MVVPTHKDAFEEKEVQKKCKDILERIENHEKREIKRIDAEIKKSKKKRYPLAEGGFDVEAELENLRSLKIHRPIISSKLLVKDYQVKSKVKIFEKNARLRLCSPQLSLIAIKTNKTTYLPLVFLIHIF